MRHQSNFSQHRKKRGKGGEKKSKILTPLLSYRLLWLCQSPLPEGKFFPALCMSDHVCSAAGLCSAGLVPIYKHHAQHRVKISGVVEFKMKQWPKRPHLWAGIHMWLAPQGKEITLHDLPWSYYKDLAYGAILEISSAPGVMYFLGREECKAEHFKLQQNKLIHQGREIESSLFPYRMRSLGGC